VGLLPDLIIRDADWWDIEHLAGMCAAAAFDTAIGRWLDPDPLRLGLHLQGRFRRLITAALLHGTIRLVEEHSRVLGAALSYHCRPGDPAPAEAASTVDAIQPGAGAAMSYRITQLFQAFDRAHPREDHDCLLLTAVTPSRTGEGVTSALLDDHVRCRVSDMTYTLAMDPGSRDLYERHGYVSVAPPMWLPDGPPVWPMRQPPKPQATGPAWLRQPLSRR
jgi:hypothetical protein